MYPSNGPPPQGAFGQPPQTAFGQSPQAAYGQPQMAQYANGVPPQPNIKWSTGLCGCGDNVSNCCITCWCPCITFGQIAEIADRGATSCGVHGVFYTVLALTGCQWIYSCMYRSKMRQQYNLMEEPCNDCILHCCCERCALCQEYRELNRTHGFDMSLGWDGNMARQNQGFAMPPFLPAEMKR